MKKFIFTSLTIISIILYFLNNFTKNYDLELQKFSKLNSNVIIINKFYGVNSYLLKINDKNEYILIDTFTSGSDQFIIKNIEKNNIKKEQIKVSFCFLKK
jgi:glyoxylase-like metal-dependent hydrolase (beta-lactamase superfamily II)